MSKESVIYAIVGPSGSGKTTLVQELIEEYPHLFYEIISYKTRKKRHDEVEGVNGYYVSKEEFIKIRNQNVMIAETVYDGHYYGADEGELLPLEEGKSALYVIDHESVELLRNQVKKIKGHEHTKVIFVYIKIDRDILEARLKNSGNRSENEIKSRIARLSLEDGAMEKADYIISNNSGDRNDMVKDFIMNVFVETK